MWECPDCKLLLKDVVLPVHCRCGLTDFGDRVERRTPPLTINQARILVDVTKFCIHCDAFPCLGPTDCKHESKLRRWKVCPQSKWFYV